MLETVVTVFAMVVIFIGMYFPSIVAFMKDREGAIIVFWVQILSFVPGNYHLVDKPTAAFILIFIWVCTLLYSGMANTVGSYEKE